MKLRAIVLLVGIAIATAIIGCEVEVPLDGDKPDASAGSGNDAPGGGSGSDGGFGSDSGNGGGSDGGGGFDAGTSD